MRNTKNCSSFGTGVLQPFAAAKGITGTEHAPRFMYDMKSFELSLDKLIKKYPYNVRSEASHIPLACLPMLVWRRKRKIHTPNLILASNRKSNISAVVFFLFGDGCSSQRHSIFVPFLSNVHDSYRDNKL
jgi:hypothetical protein